jgi:hypothetical protein
VIASEAWESASVGADSFRWQAARLEWRIEVSRSRYEGVLASARL